MLQNRDVILNLLPLVFFWVVTLGISYCTVVRHCLEILNSIYCRSNDTAVFVDYIDCGHTVVCADYLGVYTTASASDIP